MRTFLIFCTTLFLSFNVIANGITKHGDKVKGYVITVDDVKKEGIIKVGDWAENEVRVHFYQGSKKTVYKAAQLSEYGIEITEMSSQGNKQKRWIVYYQKTVDRAPVLFASKTVMMEREITGSINLYTYFIAKRDNVSKPYDYYYYLETADGEFVKINKENYKTISKKYFQDYKALVGMVGKKGFLYSNFDRMVNDYNYWTVNQHNSNEYRVALKK